MTNYLQECSWDDNGYCAVHAHFRPSTPQLTASSVTTEPVWEPPPPSYRRKDWTKVAAMLHESPGAWLKIGDLVPISVANAIRQRKIAALADGVSVRTRNNTRGENRTLTLYLKWDTPAERRRQLRKQLPKRLPEERDDSTDCV